MSKANSRKKSPVDVSGSAPLAEELAPSASAEEPAHPTMFVGALSVHLRTWENITAVMDRELDRLNDDMNLLGEPDLRWMWSLLSASLKSAVEAVRLQISTYGNTLEDHDDYQGKFVPIGDVNSDRPVLPDPETSECALQRMHRIMFAAKIDDLERTLATVDVAVGWFESPRPRTLWSERHTSLRSLLEVLKLEAEHQDNLDHLNPTWRLLLRPN